MNVKLLHIGRLKEISTFHLFLFTQSSKSHQQLRVQFDLEIPLHITALTIWRFQTRKLPLLVTLMVFFFNFSVHEYYNTDFDDLCTSTFFNIALVL